MLCCKLQAVPVRRREDLFLFVDAAPPHGTDSVDHKPRLQSSSARDHRFSGGTTALSGNDRSAFLKELRSRSTMDGTVHTTSAEQA